MLGQGNDLVGFEELNIDLVSDLSKESEER